MKKIPKSIKLWWIRNFQVITLAKAAELELTFYRNVFGDEINALNCRSLWKDYEGRSYRVDELKK